MGSVASSGIRSLVLCLVVTLSALASRAEAQIATQGAYQLSLDVNLLNSTRVDFEKEDERKSQNDLMLGIAPPGLRATLPGYFGVGGGYVLKPFLVLGAEVAFGYSRSKLHFRPDDYTGAGGGGASINIPDSKVGTFMVRPQMELFATRKQHFALGVLGAVDYRFMHAKVGSDGGAMSIGTTHGIGPLASLIAHFFITSAVSLDVRASAQRDWLRTSYEVSSHVAKSQETILAFTCGVSVWPHPAGHKKSSTTP